MSTASQPPASGAVASERKPATSALSYPGSNANVSFSREMTTCTSAPAERTRISSPLVTSVPESRAPRLTGVAEISSVIAASRSASDTSRLAGTRIPMVSGKAMRYSGTGPMLRTSVCASIRWSIEGASLGRMTWFQPPSSFWSESSPARNWVVVASPSAVLAPTAGTNESLLSRNSSVALK